MKRFLLLFLLVLVSLQSPWAAALAHCPQSGNDGVYASMPGDVSDAAHEHDAGDADDGHGAGAGHDCSAINVVALESPAARAQALPRAGANVHHVGYSGHKSHIPDGLDRPNWGRAA